MEGVTLLLVLSPHGNSRIETLKGTFCYRNGTIVLQAERMAGLHCFGNGDTLQRAGCLVTRRTRLQLPSLLLTVPTYLTLHTTDLFPFYV